MFFDNIDVAFGGDGHPKYDGDPSNYLPVRGKMTTSKIEDGQPLEVSRIYINDQVSRVGQMMDRLQEQLAPGCTNGTFTAAAELIAASNGVLAELRQLATTDLTLRIKHREAELRFMKMEAEIDRLRAQTTKIKAETPIIGGIGESSGNVGALMSASDVYKIIRDAQANSKINSIPLADTEEVE